MEKRKLLIVDGIEAGYDKSLVLKGISMEVHEGEVVTVLGANGAGKTTLLRTISGLIHPKRGRIIFKGTETTHMPPHRIALLGISHIPEGREVFPELTVYENLWMGAYKLDKRRFLENLERMYELFPRLKERRNQPAGTLSGGEQQMLAIARGLISDPDLILLDEPSLGLAPILVEEIFSVLEEIKRQGRSMVLVEQNVELGLSLADRFYILQTGKVVFKGDTSSIKDHEEIRKGYLGG